MWGGFRNNVARELKEWQRRLAHEKKEEAKYRAHAKKAKRPEDKALLLELAGRRRQMVSHSTQVVRSNQEELRKYDSRIADHEATLKLYLARKRQLNQSATAIQRAYRKASASPYTKLGRRRILRDGGFDPAALGNRANWAKK